MGLEPADVQDLVVTAFTLEALTEKEGCVTRTRDLPGKTLPDFLIAGINTGRYFALLASDVLRDQETPIFTYYVPALANSNRNKSEKTVNFGLLEIMFPTVYARMLDKKSDTIAHTIIGIMHRPSMSDVFAMRRARSIAWSTSEKQQKQRIEFEHLAQARSPMDFYGRLYTNTDPSTSHHQWAAQYHEGLPLLRDYLTSLAAARNPQAGIEATYNTWREKRPEIKRGILSDFAAAALFVHLSCQ
jgi:hypothetical protein